MNDFDQEKLDRLQDSASLSPYEKVLLEQERRARWKQERDKRTEELFDRVIKKELGEFYNYDPRYDDF